MRLHGDWVSEIRGRDASFFIEQIRSRSERDRPPRVLEIGGGDGYIASLVSRAGIEIRSTDPQPREPLHHPVEAMFASRLPFKDDSFDVIISSNVLEHIEDLPQSFDEMRRVLRSGGIMVHSMPRPICSLATTATAPIAYMRTWYHLFSGKLLAGRDFSRPLPERVPFSAWLNGQSGLSRSVYRILVVLWYLQPLRAFRIGCGHGVARGPISELIRWRESRWRSTFAAAGLDIRHVRHGDLLFSMNKLAPFRFMKARAWLARRGWASIAFFVAEPGRS